MSAQVGVVRFPGTNCDLDIWQAVEAVNKTPQWMWHQDNYNASDFEAIIIPGGFSYGDYLRCGALAAKSPVMKTVKQAAEKGIPILGICNGFQILCDAGLLPGVLMGNRSQRFIDKWVTLKLASESKPWAADKLSSCSLPVAHGEGCYYICDDGLKDLQDNDQVWWTYENNPNGSIADIAGIKNKNGNVAGLMPHPERALFDWMGGSDGLHFFN